MIDIGKAKRYAERQTKKDLTKKDGGIEAKEIANEVVNTMPAPNIELLPVGTRAYAYDVAKRMNNAPLSFTMTAALLTISTAIGRRVAVKPRLRDSWTVVPNLWGMLIAPPSIKKSPIFSEMIKPLQRLEIEANEKYEEEMKRYAAERISYEIEMKAYRQRLKEGDAPPMPEAPEEPKRNRYIINDATIEKVAEIMIDNPDGLGLFMDELSGWFNTLGKAGREADRSFWLEAFNGNGSRSVDRIGRGSIFIPHMCATIFGTIQPDTLMGFISKTMGAATGGDGLMQRFQLAVIEETADPVFTDERPDTIARAAYDELIGKIVRANPLDYGAKFDDYTDMPFYRFSPEAVEVAKAFFYEMVEEIDTNQRHNPAYATHLGKFEGLLPSLALILFYADRVTDRVDGDTIPGDYARKARELCCFYKAHAAKVYDLERMQERKREALEEKILAKAKELASTCLFRRSRFADKGCEGQRLCCRPERARGYTRS